MLTAIFPECKCLTFISIKTDRKNHDFVQQILQHQLATAHYWTTTSTTPNHTNFIMSLYNLCVEPSKMGQNRLASDNEVPGPK